MNKSIMWNHIDEEKDRLSELLKSNQVQNFSSACDLKTIQCVYFVASGSSLNVANVAKKWFETLAEVEVKADTPYNFMAKAEQLSQIDTGSTLIIAISQTGTSNGTIHSVEMAKMTGIRVLTMTEREDTPIHKLGDYYLNFLCGLEDCNAKAKGYSNSLMLLWLIALEMAAKKQHIDASTYKDYMNELRESVKDVPKTIQNALSWIENHKEWSEIKHFLVVGYGTNNGTAEEGMLKLLETLCVPGSLCEVGEFSHGFHRTLNEASTVITIFTREYGYYDMKKTNSYLKEKIGKLLVINASGDEMDSEYTIEVTYRPLTASALNIAVVFQTLAVSLPEILGNDPNYPANEDFTKLLATRG